MKHIADALRDCFFMTFFSLTNPPSSPPRPSIPPEFPAVSKAFQKAFSLAFDSLLSFFLPPPPECVGLVFFPPSFLLFHAEHLGHWKGVLEGSAVIECEAGWHGEERTCNENETSRHEETGKAKVRGRRWKGTKRKDERSRGERKTVEMRGERRWEKKERDNWEKERGKEEETWWNKNTQTKNK